MRAARNSRVARNTLLSAAVMAAFTIGTLGNVLTAQASSSKALKQARAQYKSAQNKCIKHHQLKQLPHILKLADKIKKLGGGKIKKRQLYKCIGFTISFHDGLTLKGSHHGGGWSYTHNWNYSLAQVGETDPLKPDFSSAAKDDVESSGTLLMLEFLKGGATAKSDAGCCTATQQAENAKGAHGFSAMVSIDPSAKDPRKTIELFVVANPPLEHYHTTYTGGGGGSSNETGEVWLYAYNFLHRKQKPAGIPPSLACAQTVFKVHGSSDGKKLIANRTFNTSASMPLGTTRGDCASFNGTNSIPDLSRYDPWVIPSVNVTDSTQITLEHAP